MVELALGYAGRHPIRRAIQRRAPGHAGFISTAEHHSCCLTTLNAGIFVLAVALSFAFSEAIVASAAENLVVVRFAGGYAVLSLLLGFAVLEPTGFLTVNAIAYRILALLARVNARFCRINGPTGLLRASGQAVAAAAGGFTGDFAGLNALLAIAFTNAALGIAFIRALACSANSLSGSFAGRYACADILVRIAPKNSFAQPITLGRAILFWRADRSSACFANIATAFDL